MSNKQIFDNILKQQHFIDARALGLADSMVKALEKSLESVVSAITRLQVQYLSESTYDNLSYTKKKNLLTKQAEEIRNILASVYLTTIESLITNAQLDAMTYSQAQTYSTLAPLLNIDLDYKKITLQNVVAFQNSSVTDGLVFSEWLKRMENVSAEKIIQASRQSLILGESVQQLSTRLRRDGIEGTRPKTDALSRTALMSGANQAREQAVLAIAGDDLDFQWLYVSTLDNRTCLRCGPLDGKLYAKDEPRPQTPLHVSCRCVYVPVFFDDISYTRPSTKWDSRQVNHRDGSTSTKYTVAKDPKTEQAKVELTTENYSQWLRRQLETDPDFVKSILGKSRFELYSQGKLDISKMVSDNRILSLAELK